MKTNPLVLKFESRLLAAALVLLLAPAVVFSTTTKHHSTSRTKTHSRKYLSRFSKVRRRLPLRRSSSTHHAVASSRYRRSGHSRRYSRASSSRRRITPHTEIQPGRAGQIQQALIEAGDLHGQPTGQWDAQTRAAMKLYQKQNGFATTGLPDAKSLMKMGLGPHPLPTQVDPLARASEAQAAQPGNATGASLYGVAQPSQPAEQANAGAPVPDRNTNNSEPQQFPPQQ